jgi:Zn finger protein HypA/HybF involved in hydrogenase expression
MSQKANCPSCGGPVTFEVSTSLVTICEYCRSVVARGDRGLESLGKVADLVETESPLDVGIKGRWAGQPFTLTGRAQLQHPAGGVWDEWYLSLPEGKWGWLAEAQGKFYLTFDVAPPDQPRTYEDAQLGQAIVTADGVRLVVAEKNTAALGGARGEIPTRLEPGKAHPFVDLSGPNGLFGTIDWSSGKASAYLGREVTLDELGIPKSQRRRYPGQEPKIQALSLNCPQCGGAITLQAPDKSERVGCPNCGSALDVREGKLSLLKSLKKPKVAPVIPLGARGTRDGVEWACLGFLQRSVRIEGTDYFWEEYLLYQPRLGFRWLTSSDGHWNWVEPLPPGCVEAEGRYAAYAGRTFALFQSAEATVRVVYGEFYWKVQAGEKVQSSDYVSAPYLLSEERSASEIHWSRGEYMTPQEVQGMFGLAGALSTPEGVGPNQPFPYTGVYTQFLYLAGALLLISLLWFLVSPRQTVLEEEFPLTPVKDSASKKVSFHRSVTLGRHRNIRVLIRAISGGWVGVEGMLSPGEGAPPEARFSVWAVAGGSDHVYHSAVPPGDYSLVLTFSWGEPDSQAAAAVTITSGVAHPSPVAHLMLLFAVVPFVVGLYQLYWEQRRWSNSNVT